MKQVLQLGLQSVITPRRFAETPSNLRARALVFLDARAMGSKRLLSNSPKPESSPIVMNKKDKKLKGSMDVNPLHDKDVVKSIKDDPGKIEAMTVQELRTTLRSVGVPVKGCKRDLVNALKCFLDDKTEGADEKIWVAEECVSSKIKTNSTEYVLSKSEVNTRVKEPAVKDRIVTTKQELSIKINEVSGKKRSGAKRKVSSEIGDEVVGASDLVEPWTVLTHKKPQPGWIPYNPKTMRPPPLLGGTQSLKLMSWNVNGLRALLKLEGFSALQLAEREEFDVLCLQETKLQEKDVETIKQSLIDGYENSFWTCSVSKLGYSGTAIVSRIKPLSVRYGLGISDHDSEGRLVTAEFDSFYLISGYIPNSGDGLKRLSYRVTEWDSSLSSYMKELEKSKPVILTGDLNCAHQEIDIHDPAGNKRSAGFTNEERESFEKNFLSRGFVDTFRKQHPDAVGYTYWGYRHGGRKSNKGWRLDYFLVSESIADKVHDSYILPDVAGSDHCPIGLILKL